MYCTAYSATHHPQKQFSFASCQSLFKCDDPTLLETIICVLRSLCNICFRDTCSRKVTGLLDCNPKSNGTEGYARRQGTVRGRLAV